MLANEAADAVTQGIGTAADVDLALQKGVNYPRGPLAWADALGVADKLHDAVFDAACLAKVKVSAKVVEHVRGPKLVVFKFRLRKNYVRRNGHRQDYTAVKIAAIQA